eukprot:TRINITY_DN15108_c0_g1_i1.p1 TRINITY_DN15108_c0_g1~~TRINITY_DN15108_c0_g1_i1.p1  ORF type:complete len:604 (-),score=102.80 TRINITY_DN15108_c0_g1_i1:31-1842(-)
MAEEPGPASATTLCSLDGQVLGDEDTEHQYVVGRVLGKGSFGEVRRGSCVATGELVAIKVQDITDSEGKETNANHLNVEHSCMKAVEDAPGFPRALCKGQTHSHYFLVMSHLGPSLHDLLDKNGGTMSVKTVCLLGLRALTRLETLHNRGFVHCDIKPENFLMGPGTTMSDLFVVDFGLSLRWKMANGKHIKYRDGKHGITGTLRYCSLNAHAGIELSRRDDLESLGYTMLFLARGGLPWQGLPGNKEEKRQRVYEKKQSTTLQELCQNFPAQFITYIQTVRALRYDQTPDYAALKKLLQGALAAIKATDDGLFDWLGDGKTMPLPVSRLKRALEEPDMPPAKRQRFSLGRANPAQWIVAVTRIYAGVRQTWTRQNSYTELVDWLKENEWGSDSGLFVTGLCHTIENVAQSVWTCVLSSETGYQSQQIKKCSTPQSAEAWIKKKRELGFQVTAIAGHVHNSCLVVVVSRLAYLSEQAYCWAEVFPRMWVESQWKKGYYITAMGTAGNHWLVVMTRDPKTDFCRQWFQTSHTFPSKAIQERWSLGFRITTMASKDCLFACVMTQSSKRATSQGYNCTATWAPDYIEDAWKQKRYIAALCWKLDP